MLSLRIPPPSRLWKRNIRVIVRGSLKKSLEWMLYTHSLAPLEHPSIRLFKVGVTSLNRGNPSRLESLYPLPQRIQLVKRAAPLRPPSMGLFEIGVRPLNIGVRSLDNGLRSLGNGLRSLGNGLRSLNIGVTCLNRGSLSRLPSRLQFLSIGPHRIQLTAGSLYRLQSRFIRPHRTQVIVGSLAHLQSLFIRPYRIQLVKRPAPLKPTLIGLVTIGVISPNRGNLSRLQFLFPLPHRIQLVKLAAIEEDFYVPGLTIYGTQTIISEACRVVMQSSLSQEKCKLLANCNIA